MIRVRSVKAQITDLLRIVKRIGLDDYSGDNLLHQHCPKYKWWTHGPSLFLLSSCFAGGLYYTLVRHPGLEDQKAGYLRLESSFFWTILVLHYQIAPVDHVCICIYIYIYFISIYIHIYVWIRISRFTSVLVHRLFVCTLFLSALHIFTSYIYIYTYVYILMFRLYCIDTTPCSICIPIYIPSKHMWIYMYIYRYMIYDVYILSLQHSYHSSIFRLMHRHYVNSIHRDLSSKVLFQSTIHHRTILQRCSYFASLTVLLESKTFQNIQMQLSNVVKFGRVHLSVCRMEEINTRRERKKRTTSENKWFGTSTKSTGTFVWMVCSPVILQTYQEVAPAIQGSKQEPRKVGQTYWKLTGWFAWIHLQHQSVSSSCAALWCCFKSKQSGLWKKLHIASWPMMVYSPHLHLEAYICEFSSGPNHRDWPNGLSQDTRNTRTRRRILTTRMALMT